MVQANEVKNILGCFGSLEYSQRWYIVRQSFALPAMLSLADDRYFKRLSAVPQALTSSVVRG
jgi:hypothetical protein